jgi:hypothetical protein
MTRLRQKWPLLVALFAARAAFGQASAAAVPAAAPPTPADAPVSAPASATTRGSARTTTKAPALPAAANAPPATRGRGATDRIDLDAAQITGNRELPKVLYIVPWKRPDLGDLLGKPVNSLLDEVLAPVDRDVFKRENRYFQALQTPGGAAAPTPSIAPVPPATNPAAQPSGDGSATPPGKPGS